MALALLAPVIVGAFGFHMMLAPEGIAPIAIALVLELYLAWAYRAAFAPMLQARVEPARDHSESHSHRVSPLLHA